MSCIKYPMMYARAVVGTGAAGAFAPFNFRQWVHAPVLKRLFELLDITNAKKKSGSKSKTAKIDAMSTHFIL